MKTTCANRFFPCVALTLAVLVMSTSSAHAQLSHTLTSITPELSVVTGQSNLSVNVKVQLGLTDNDTDSTSISGAMDAAFGIDFDSGNLRISDFQILDGTLIANNSMQFNLSFIVVSINATTSNIAGTPFSPGPSMLTTAARPGVTGFYSAGDHGLSLNQGIINVSGAVSNQINLADDPVEGFSTSATAGQVILTQTGVDLNANTTTYSLTTVLPIGVQSVQEDSGATITITGTGSVRSTVTDLVFDWVPWNGIAGDIDQNGFLEPADVDAFVDGWRSTNDTPGLKAYMQGDVNFDGITDLYDAAIFRNALKANALGMGALASVMGSAAVPEPATWATGLIGVGLLLAGRRRLRRRA